MASFALTSRISSSLFQASSRLVRLSLLTLLSCGCISSVLADVGEEDFFEMSLGELLGLKVTSASKKSEPLSQAAAAVFVITQDDLRRSGVTTVPEALRMVPGIQVARIDANVWSVSARGGNGRFANKLLVMIDGRSVYTPQFSGVYWDVQTPMLEDIDRIEVIRGPGATLWGANAVNGVINIITQSSADTQDGLFAGRVGDEERASGALRWGGKVGDLGHYRVYGSYDDRDGSRDASGRLDNADDWNIARAGFRSDLTPGGGDQLSLQGNLYDGRHGETAFDQSLSSLGEVTVDRTTEVLGGDALMTWQRHLSASDDFSVKTYYDHTERDWTLFDEIRDTFDVELEYRTQRYHRHDLLTGLGYRYTRDRSKTNEVVILDREKATLSLFSFFIQDDIRLIADRLTLTLGSKLEHNNYTGFEIQPNVRLLWTPTSDRTFWTSVARAVRTPGRGEREGAVRQSVLWPNQSDNPGSIPIEVIVLGNEGFDSEDLIAYEAGHRWRVGRRLSFDLALFYNQYSHLRSSTQGEIQCRSGGEYPACLYGDTSVDSLILPLVLGNDSQGFSKGFELVLDWSPLSNWRLQGAYSYLESQFGADSGSQSGEMSKRDPNNQLSLRSWFNPREDVDLDVWLRYTDELDARIGYFSYSIDPYWELDVRVAWRPIRRLELALVGQNLLNDVHSEGASELADLPLASLERSVYFSWRLDF